MTVLLGRNFRWKRGGQMQEGSHRERERNTEQRQRKGWTRGYRFRKADRFSDEWWGCFFCDPADVGNLVSGSSALSKSSLNIWKFMVHVLLKPGLENFLLACEMSAVVQKSSRKSKRIPGEHLHLLYWLRQSLWLCISQQKGFDCVDHNKLENS